MGGGDMVDLGTERTEPSEGSRRARGYLSRPDGRGPWPGLVVVHEIFGIDDVMRRHADRLAGLGYVALMPDLFADGGALRCLVPTFRAFSAGAGKPFADLENARQHLRSDPDCTGRVGVIGFCMGGGFALAVADRGYDAAAPNYGRLPDRFDDIIRGSCPIVASYGGRDGSLKGVAARIEAAAAAAGVPHDVREYPSAGHAFLNDAEVGPRVLRPIERIAGIGPEPVAAADAWRRIEAFFAEHLAGAPATATADD